MADLKQCLSHRRHHLPNHHSGKLGRTASTHMLDRATTARMGRCPLLDGETVRRLRSGLSQRTDPHLRDLIIPASHINIIQTLLSPVA